MLRGNPKDACVSAVVKPTVNNSKNKGYMINVASYRNGVGYGKWTHIDGFSESIIDYIREYEKTQFENKDL